MARPKARALKSKATAVCWVVLVSSTQRKAGYVSSKLLTQVLGADSVLRCLLEKLKVGGDCVYRWAVLWTQVSNVSTLRAPFLGTTPLGKGLRMALALLSAFRICQQSQVG